MSDNNSTMSSQVGNDPLHHPGSEQNWQAPQPEFPADLWQRSEQWSQVKGQVKQRWGYLTDDSFMHSQVDWQQFVGVLQRCTGESQQAIVWQLDSMIDREPESEGSVGMGNHFSHW